MPRIKIGLAQINPTVGDLEGNKNKILEFTALAKKKGVGLVIFPELAVTGYPPEDLLLKKSFVRDNVRILKRIARYSNGIDIVVGFADYKGGDTYNAGALLRRGRIEGVYRKVLLPNYGVFDEKRYFKPGREPFTFVLKGIKFALTICEDIWNINGLALKLCAALRPHAIINISASPYHFEKEKMREAMLRALARRYRANILYCNMTGGQDELVFDGASRVCDSKGVFRYRARRFEEHLGTALLSSGRDGVFIERSEESARPLGQLEEIYNGLVLGTRDYLRKNSFSKALLGLSGGIDSSLTAKIACDAIGNENVVGVSMPSRYSSRETQLDARRVAENLGIGFIIIPVDKIFSSYLESLSDIFKALKPNIAEENLQARIRGNTLMALSNKFGWLVLTTGNKSEISMGYCTLYGDTAGGFAVIKDVPKTLVYKLTDFINKAEGREIIPRTVIRRPPTAELKPDQKDEDTLPPYKVLDRVLKLYIERGKSLEDIVKNGFQRGLVRDIINKVDRNEYKRRQSPPGVKITPRAFGKDWRFPIVNRYKA